VRLREEPDLAAVRREIAAMDSKILRKIGEESVRNGTDKFTSAQIDAIIQEDPRARRRTSP
jgi:hypothetical protein